MPRFVDATRAQLICPAGNAALYRATNAIVSFLLAEQQIRAWGGFTYSSIAPTVFVGKYWDTDRASWEEDQNAIIFLDVPELSPDALLPYLATLRDRVNAAYASAGQPQKAVWITAHPIQIVADSD